MGDTPHHHHPHSFAYTHTPFAHLVRQHSVLLVPHPSTPPHPPPNLSCPPPCSELVQLHGTSSWARVAEELGTGHHPGVVVKAWVQHISSRHNPLLCYPLPLHPPLL
jgi:hypothetical protein